MSDLTLVRENKYSKYGLYRNPFPSIPIETAWSKSHFFFEEIFEKEINRLRFYLNRLRKDKTKVIYLIGETGSGKSSVIIHFLNEISTSKSLDLDTVYMDFWFSSAFYPLYWSALWWFGKDYVWQLCKKAFRKWRYRLGILENCSFLSPSEAFSKLFFVGDNIKFPVLVEMLSLASENCDLIIGVDGFNNIYSHISDLHKIDLLYGLSRLIEGISGNTLIMLAMPPEIENWITVNRNKLVAVGVSEEFIEPDMIYVSKINSEKACNLVAGYLDIYRTPNFSSNKLFPFTKEGIELICKQSRSNLRNFLLNCHDILTFALQHDYDIIREEVVLNYFKVHSWHPLNF